MSAANDLRSGRSAKGAIAPSDAKHWGLNFSGRLPPSIEFLADLSERFVQNVEHQIDLILSNDERRRKDAHID